jgi:hypothetical protein
MPEHETLTRSELDSPVMLKRAGILSDVAEKLIAPLGHEYEAYARIVHLYRMQLLWFFPNNIKLPKLNKRAKKPKDRQVDSEIIMRGRRMAAIEVLDKLVREVRKAGLVRAARGPQDPFYGNFDAAWPIFREHLWPENGEHRRILRMRRKKALRTRIEARNDVTIGPARIVYVLYHARELLENLYPNSNGASAALEVVRHKKSPYYFGKQSAILGYHWKEMKKVAIFHYLLQFQRFQFGIINIQDKNFLGKMLEKANDIEGLKVFFRTHDHIASLLNERGWDFPILGVVGSEVAHQLEEVEVHEWVIERLKMAKGHTFPG